MEYLKLRTILLFVLASILFASPSYAALDLLLTQGIDAAMPIAIVPFAGQSDPQAPDSVSTIISNDLRNSGRFKLLPNNAMPELPHAATEVESASWRKTGVESVVVGKVNALSANRCQVSFTLLDIYKNNNAILLQQSFSVNGNELRRSAHIISDLIYQQLTGIRGIFSTRIAYTIVQRTDKGSRYTLEVADADGYNPRPLLVSKEPIMSPAWSHDGKRIAYVSFENRKAEIYVINIANGEHRLISSYAGINGAPAWSPDDSKLAIVLSKDGSPNLYVMDLLTTQLRPLTQDNAINTEPSWAPDGQSIIFTSDRGGSPQIYRYYLDNKRIQRITFVGNYNTHAIFTPDGKNIVLLHRENGQYNIGLQDIAKGTLQLLTSSGRDESPSLSANGLMVLYGSEYGKLGMVSLDGRVRLSLPTRDGDIRQPIWSPFLS